MFISSINSVPMAKNYVKVNKNKNNSYSTTNSSNFMHNHRTAHKPSFGLAPFVTGGIVAILVAHIIDTYRGQKQINELKEKQSQIIIPSEEVQEMHNEEVNNIHDEEEK